MVQPLDKLEAEIIAWINEYKPLIGLDFDGTLAPIGPDPAAIWLSADTIELLRRFCARYECAFVSGRMLSDLKPRVPIEPAHYIGTHGAEIERRGQPTWVYENKAWNEWRMNRFAEFKTWVGDHGGTIEDKTRSFSLHFRQAPDQRWWEGEAGPALDRWFAGVATVLNGVKVWNISPLGAPNKGTAARELCRQLGREALFFCGDEATDENVFRLTGLNVFGVKVGEGPTAARARVGSPLEVLEILRRLA